MLADAGIMLHLFDYWELWGQEWRPGKQQIMSSSYVHRGQHQAGSPKRMPLYEEIPGISGGFVLRPGATPITCGGVDACLLEWCDSPDDNLHYNAHTQKKPYAGWMDCDWKPADLGKWFEIQVRWQLQWKSWERNEVIVKGPEWEAALPRVVDAVVVSKGRDNPEMARRVHHDFLQRYPELSEGDCPLILFDADNWDAPFSVLGDYFEVLQRAREQEEQERERQQQAEAEEEEEEEEEEER